MRTGHVIILAGLLTGASPGVAQAFCVTNEAAVDVHVQSLDPDGFQADLRPGAQACCAEPGCVNPRRGTASLLVVSGYVPLAGGGRPGWRAECRAQVGPRGEVVVGGALTSLSCHAR